MSLDTLDQDLLSLGYIPSSEIIGSNVYISSTLLNNPKLLSKVGIPVSAFTTSIREFPLVYQQMSVSNFCQPSEYSLLQTNQLKPITMALMHSLVGNEFEHLICLLVIWIFSFYKYLFNYFTHFLLGCLSFSVYILDTSFCQ